jgi:hypothetical protein
MLKKGTGTDELNLQAIDTTCMREARSVNALSGSQKFRCAVAIAFGIGQYAGAGGMRSIVIDEGFGGLDDIGQQLPAPTDLRGVGPNRPERSRRARQLLLDRVTLLSPLQNYAASAIHPRLCPPR